MVRIVLVLVLTAILVVPGWENDGIVHDAEYYILEAQNGERWAAEDQELDKILADLREKHGQRPNIIHIL
jgi:arylsulfatase